MTPHPRLGERRSRVLFFGTLSPVGRPARGGPEAANRRTVKGLQHRGVRVSTFAYPAFTRRTAGGFLVYVLRYAFLPPLALAAMLRHAGQGCHVYVASLYRHFLPLDLFICVAARCFGHHLVLDIRAGSYRSSYESRGPLYRAGCRAVLSAADLIVSQDPKTVDYLRRLTGRSAEYVPNHTECVSAAEPSRPEPGVGDEVRLIYFGAMRMEKGIDRIVTACGWLVRRGQPASLTLIGASQPRVRAEIEALACANGITSFVAIHPPVSPDELRGLCAHGHFFLFPTRWIGEGHSNSLTEAMAWGLVPIASDWGCNALVVGDAGRVLRSSASGEEYAAAIEEIWTRREWKTLSDLSRERVRRLYSTDVVLPRLIHLLDGINDVRSRPRRRREPGPLRRSASPPDA